MPEQVMMPNWLMQRAYLTPDRTAVETKEESISFKNLHHEALYRAGGLKKLGVSKGDHIAVLMGNSIEMVKMLHAIFYTGATAVLLNTRLSKEEWLYQIQDSRSIMTIADHAYFDKLLVEKSQKWTAGDVFMQGEKPASYLQEFDLNDTAVIMYTSGTTGKPKGVMQTFGNHYWSAAGSALNLGLHSEDKWLAAVPLFHISGLSILFRSVIYGMTIQLHQRFDAEVINQSIMEDRISIISVVGTMLASMLDELEGRQYPNTFRCMLLGGGPAPAPLLNGCRDKGIPVFQTYGMTETSSQFATLSTEDAFKKLGSAGKPLFPCQIKIIGEDGTETDTGTPGEITVKGPNVMKGYWNKEEETNKVLKDGWLHTGDIGRMDEEGFLYVLDRRSDLIISGGENIYPAEIESILLEHPAVKEAGVAGIPDEKWGQVPYGFIVEAEPVSEEELIRYSTGKLAKYKVPKGFAFVHELPRNASRKLQRHLLKELKQ
ncbi:o-succinylbenzoate--CoA ligase [Bacillus sp. FJAT-42376]|uniref:o-succinylbenzoate--CoA ligase n=1 Tax=Bacillus sp. FJAT-42376 TaxID=2014076 RepID=UPI000F4F3289|nr:o-succinylbenzoate--CoA ligase [Bacillus sp. FJAT-42376]AZB44101.1 o-succinylbenzoate--CoA ligase [Bacillus sp. FJAT-42376]